MHYTPNMYGTASLARVRFKSTIDSSRKVDLTVIESAAINGRTPEEVLGASTGRPRPIDGSKGQIQQ